MDSSSPSDFEEMMAALGLLTSRFNWLETEFKLALIKLLNCSNQNVAYAVVEEWRGFEKLITLVDRSTSFFGSITQIRSRESNCQK